MPRRKRRSRRSRGQATENRHIRSVRNFFRKTQRILFASPLAGILIILLLVFGSTDFLVLLAFADAPITNIFHDENFFVFEDEALRLSAELVKQKYKIFLLLSIVIFAAGNFKRLGKFFFKENLNVVFLLFVLMIGYRISIEPQKVLSNTVNILFAFVACSLFAISQRDTERLFLNMLKVVLISVSVVLLGSLLLLTQLDVNALDNLAQDKRYGGLAGNPNSLGILAALGIWAGAAIYFHQLSQKFTRIIIILLLLAFTYLLILSGSATALLISIMAVFAILWGKVLQRLTKQSTIILNLTAVLIGLVVSIIFVTLFTGDSFFAIFTEKMGKDATLTGRTDFWEIARAAIADRPWLGWSYDSHISVFDDPRFYIPLRQYHNGYLDTLVAGGIALGVALFIHLFVAIRNMIKARSISADVYAVSLPLVFLLLHNFTEYSMLRTNSILWQVYMLTYTTVAIFNSRMSIR